MKMGKIEIAITEGSMRGRSFVFHEHDTLILGRMPDCHMYLPGDPMVSRHHFIIEVNPPDLRIRDLGSLNGTFVNGMKHGARMEDETPEEGANRKYPEVDLKDGDSITVGETVLKVHIETPMFCCECGIEIADDAREKYAWIGGTFICNACRKKAVASAKPAKRPEPLRCQKCGKNVTKEIRKAGRGNYICDLCRLKVENDPMKLLVQLILKEKKILGSAGAPKLDGYEIVRKIGQGGMGSVYLARRKTDSRNVAIKVMLAKGVVNDRARKVFQREIDITKDLRHSNIIEFIDHGNSGTAFFFVLEYCDGGSVDTLMRKNGGKLSLKIAGPIMLQTLEGLAYVHSMNHVHRDLKPQNILLTDSSGNWTAKIADLGLAKNFDQAGLSGMTMTGDYAGTSVFMPREQVTNYRDVKPVSDVWSIGATFYNMLTGHVPRDVKRGQDPMEVVLRGSIVPIRNRDSSIPKKVGEVIEHALSSDIGDRYQNAAEMHKALARIL